MLPKGFQKSLVTENYTIKRIKGLMPIYYSVLSKLDLIMSNSIMRDYIYKIQLINIERELDDGNKITGKKIGLTSLAVQNMLGVNTPDFGHLLDSMEVKDNTIQINTMLQPKVEGEIAFVLKEDVKGPNATVEEVLNATEYIAAAIEIVDSRIENWKIGLIDTVADNASSGMYGQDLIIKLGRSELLEVVCVVSHRESENLQAVREKGIDASAGGVDYLIEKYKGVIKMVFDCTSASGHLVAAPKLKEAGMFALDFFGYILANDEVSKKLFYVKTATNSHTSMLPQILCAEFFKRGFYPAHHKMICDLYRERRDEMIECIDKYFPKGTKRTTPDGGLFMWVELPEGINTTE